MQKKDNKIMQIWKDKDLRTKIIHLVSFLVFCVLLITVFLRVTYIFRNSNDDRRHITAIKSEEPVDIVYIGGSDTFRYWEGPRAYGEYGITSYGYATNSIQAEGIKGEIREVLKYQDPRLFIIDLRPFQYWSEKVAEGGTRNVTDSLDYSLNRFMLVHDILSNRIPADDTEDTDAVSYYFDIVKYHTETDRLGKEGYWQNWKNTMDTPWSGYEFAKTHEFLSIPDNVYTEERGELKEGSEKTLIDLLKFCQQKELNVLFVACPYWITEEHWKLYNAMQDLIESYGFKYLNANAYYEEMGIDWSLDFYNISHMNSLGSEKYTRFLAEYILEHYQLLDHRNDDDTELRDTQWQDFLEKDEETKEAIYEVVEGKQIAYKDGGKLKNIENPFEWAMMSQNDNYTVFIADVGEAWASNSQTEKLLPLLSLTIDNMEDAIRIYSGTTSIYKSDKSLEENYEKKFSDHTDFNPTYEINSGDECTIKIDDKEYALNKEGLNIVVWDNNYREVLDSVTIIQDKEGDLILERS